MSSEAGTQKYDFIVYAPDYAAEGTFELRKSVHAEHLARMGGLLKKGVVKGGGALTTLETTTLPPAEKKMVGSAIIIEAESVQEVKDIIENDIYWKAGVWDKEKMVINGLHRGPTH